MEDSSGTEQWREKMIKWCWHKWGQWKVSRRALDGDFGTPIVYQEQHCEKCGKVKMRSVTP